MTIITKLVFIALINAVNVRPIVSSYSHLYIYIFVPWQHVFEDSSLVSIANCRPFRVACIESLSVVIKGRMKYKYN